MSKTILAIGWFVFTLALVGWWWVYLLKSAELTNSAHRMFFWEGSSLIAFVLAGGGMLVYLTYRDEYRHERLKFFFSNFTHDIKTSIARLQLQAEVLREQATEKNNPVLQRLVNDVQRLDLQLENSLWFANLDDSQFFIESISLSDLVNKLKGDFEGINLNVSGDARVQADRRALNSVFRNLFQNSALHGKAKAISIKVRESHQNIQVIVEDDGVGFGGPLEKLGAEALREHAGRGNGLGLLLSKKLMKKMRGDLQFTQDARKALSAGFKVELVLPGERL